MAREIYDVSGKVVLVTGAARGIGAEAARQLRAQGARVALVGLEPDELEARARELGSEAAAFHADVTDSDALEQVVDDVVERFGGIDVVIANAGVAVVGTLATMRMEDFERLVDVNVTGVYRTIRATLPHVVERRGYVLPVASLAAAMHVPLMGPYPATKAAVEALADTLRLEVSPSGTAVGCAYFGFIDTDMVRDAFSHPATEPMRETSPGWFARPIPVQKAGRAIVTGIRRRARVVAAPGWVRIALTTRGVLQPLTEFAALRDDALPEALRRAEGTAGREAPAATVPERGQRQTAVK